MNGDLVDDGNFGLYVVLAVAGFVRPTYRCGTDQLAALFSDVAHASRNAFSRDFWALVDCRVVEAHGAERSIGEMQKYRELVERVFCIPRANGAQWRFL
jgi:hypothetical protein